MEYQNLIYEQKDEIAWITLNRPKAMNALNTALIQELMDVFEKVEVDDAVRVAVIKGAGGKAFSAGADLKEIEALGTKSAFDYSRVAHRAFSRIEQQGKPVIACINGMAMGGGAELALSCHMRIASNNSQLGFPESGLGGIPGMGGSQRLPRLIGKSLGLSYLLTGDMITAEDGLRLGLYYKILPDEEIEAGAEKVAKKLAKKSPMSLKFIIQAVVNGLEESMEGGLVLESALMSAMSTSEDKKEGLKAIFEKRTPNFKGQ